MPMSKNEFSALLLTMDTLISLCEIAQIKGNIEQIDDLNSKLLKLRTVRDLAKNAN